VDAVETFKNAMLKVLATIEAVRDPEGMATLMFNYSNLQVGVSSNLILL
jgi:adenine-specific DNA methylase